MLKICSFLILFVVTERCEASLGDICIGDRNRKVHLGARESGVLTALNVTRFGAPETDFYESCHVEIFTCPACVVSLTFVHINLSCQCGCGTNLFFYNPCRCDYVWITEPSNQETSGLSFCGVHSELRKHSPGLTYKSKSRTVRVSLFFRKTHGYAFSVATKSEPNRQFFFGSSRCRPGGNNSSGFLTSPFFPAFYPPDLVIEYVLVCSLARSNVSSFDVGVRLPQDDLKCRVHLTFTDFHLSPSSFMEFYEGSRYVNTVSGTSFRPPAILSKSNSLSLRFFASAQNNIGFKAHFSFLSESIASTMKKPVTDCGGVVEDFGGTITMMNIVDSQMELFDCVWLIKPLTTFFYVKTHLYLKVTSFLNFAGDAELQIRRGPTSESPILEKIRYPLLRNSQEHVIPLQLGYYVSLRALFGPASRFAITYAAFTHDKCFLFSEFLCQNLRCISKKLRCDGFDHCGDNSDESEGCYQRQNSESSNGMWYAHFRNYYFPKINGYGNARMSSATFLISLMGLIFLIIILTVALYRMGAKICRQDQLREHLQPISEFSVLVTLADDLSDEVSVEDIVIDDPPSYEPPPAYEDVIKPQ